MEKTDYDDLSILPKGKYPEYKVRQNHSRTRTRGTTHASLHTAAAGASGTSSLGFNS